MEHSTLNTRVGWRSRKLDLKKRGSTSKRGGRKHIRYIVEDFEDYLIE